MAIQQIMVTGCFKLEPAVCSFSTSPYRTTCFCVTCTQPVQIKSLTCFTFVNYLSKANRTNQQESWNHFSTFDGCDGYFNLQPPKRTGQLGEHKIGTKAAAYIPFTLTAIGVWIVWPLSAASNTQHRQNSDCVRRWIMDKIGGVHSRWQ